MPDASWGGLAALNPIVWIVTHGVAMGWYIAGPLALHNAKSFSGILPDPIPLGLIEARQGRKF